MNDYTVWSFGINAIFLRKILCSEPFRSILFYLRFAFYDKQINRLALFSDPNIFGPQLIKKSFEFHSLSTIIFENQKMNIKDLSAF